METCTKYFKIKFSYIFLHFDGKSSNAGQKNDFVHASNFFINASYVNFYIYALKIACRLYFIAVRLL